MNQAMEPIRLAGTPLHHSRHVCAFFHSKEEEYRVLMPFIKDGFVKGDRAFHVVDPNHRPTHLERLQREGIDVAEAEAKGQLEVRRWGEAYIKDDHFDQYRMIETIKDALDPAKKPAHRNSDLHARRPCEQGTILDGVRYVVVRSNLNWRWGARRWSIIDGGWSFAGGAVLLSDERGISRR